MKSFFLYHTKSGMTLKFFKISLVECFLNHMIFWIGKDDITPAFQL